MAKKVLVAIPREGTDPSKNFNLFDIQKEKYPPTEEGKYFIPDKFSRLVLAFERYGIFVKRFVLDSGELKVNEFVFEIGDKCDEETLAELEMFSVRYCKCVRFVKVLDDNVYVLKCIFKILSSYDHRNDADMLRQFDDFYVYDTIRSDMKKILNRMYYIEARKELDKNKKKNKKKKK